MASEIHEENLVEVVSKQQIPRNSSNQESKNLRWRNARPRPAQRLTNNTTEDTGIPNQEMFQLWRH